MLYGQEATELGTQGPFSKCMVVLNPGDVVCKTRWFPALSLVRSSPQGELDKTGLLLLWAPILLLTRWFSECWFIWDDVSCAFFCQYPDNWELSKRSCSEECFYAANQPNKIMRGCFFGFWFFFFLFFSKKEISFRVIILAPALERLSFLCVQKVHIQGHAGSAMVFPWVQ